MARESIYPMLIKPLSVDSDFLKIRFMPRLSCHNFHDLRLRIGVDYNDALNLLVDGCFFNKTDDSSHIFLAWHYHKLKNINLNSYVYYLPRIWVGGVAKRLGNRNHSCNKVCLSRLKDLDSHDLVILDTKQTLYSSAIQSPLYVFVSNGGKSDACYFSPCKGYKYSEISEESFFGMFGIQMPLQNQ